MLLGGGATFFGAKMDRHLSTAPYLALVDDDTHSARLMSRMLIAHGSPAVAHWGDAAQAEARTLALLDSAPWRLPGLMLVDLKASSRATLDFITGLLERVRRSEMLIAAIVPDRDDAMRSALRDAGSAAVFAKPGDIAAYRREAASIVSFWVRHQRFQAVGT